MTARLWKLLGLSDAVTLQINSLGSSESRVAYREQLVAYFGEHHDKLDEDSQRRLHSNPLRILDSKNPQMRDIVEAAPKLTDQLDDESQAHFAQLRSLLDAAQVKYEINPCLVRGLDYYSKTVFEWVTDRLGAQGTVCAGGRFDGLVEQLGGKATSAIGFAMGLERLTALLEHAHIPVGRYRPHAYLVRVGDKVQQFGLTLAEQLRDALPDLRLENHCGGGSFKSQFKRADKSGARVALILGEEEMENATVGVKFLREEREQESVHLDELQAFLAALIRSGE